MKVEQILSLLEEKVAPVKLSDNFCKKYGLYDNSGIIINCGNEVTGVLFTLDLTAEAVSKAVSSGFNVIITHHPAVYGGISRFDLVANPQAAALAECVKNGVSVISMHLNFDAAERGIDYRLMQGLGGENARILADIDGGGYGRVYSVSPQKLSIYSENVSKEFKTDRLLVYGRPDKLIKKAASFCGAGCDDKAMAFACEQGADVFISSDMKHHEILNLTRKGLAVLILTHYASENYGFEKIYLEIKESLNVKSAYYTDADLL